MTRIILFILFVSWPLSATAQPVSWGMAQCSALMDVMEGYLTRQPEKGYVADAAEKMFAAAELRAGVEGRNRAELTQVHRQKRDEWSAMGYTMAFRSEFRDWVGYCRSLAKAHDIALDKSMLR